MTRNTALDLSGKTALITGAAGGIGLAVARRFIDHGATVWIMDIRSSDAAKLVDAGFRLCDVSSETDTAAAIADCAEQLGGLDIVVNNAGLTDLGGDIESMDMAYFERMQRVNVLGVMHGLKHAPQHMRDGGSIINTASLAAFWHEAGTAAYNASKAAVVSLTRTSALELGARGIRVNAVCPGHTVVDRPNLDQQTIDVVLRQCRLMTALGRIAEVDEQAAVFHFLAADESRYITGQAIVVDGGMGIGNTPATSEALGLT